MTIEMEYYRDTECYSDTEYYSDYAQMHYYRDTDYKEVQSTAAVTVENACLQLHCL